MNNCVHGVLLMLRKYTLLEFMVLLLLPWILFSLQKCFSFTWNTTNVFSLYFQLISTVFPKSLVHCLYKQDFLGFRRQKTGQITPPPHPPSKAIKLANTPILLGLRIFSNSSLPCLHPVFTAFCLTFFLFRFFLHIVFGIVVGNTRNVRVVK